MTRFATLIVLALFAAEVSAQNSSAASATLVTVNKQPLTREALDAYKRSAPPGNVPPDDAALDLLINIEILSQEGKKLGLDKTPEFLADVDNQRRNILARAVMKKILQNKPITEEELQQAYKKRVDEMSRKEYKLSHIVSASEADAKAVIAELDKGQNFAALAKAKSTDVDSRERGGSLPWLDPARMPPTVKDAAATLTAPNTYTKTPVKTDMGWHVFMLESTRDVAPPPYETVKAQLRAGLENERVNAYVADLKKTVPVELAPAK